MKEEAPYRNLWRSLFGRGYGHVTKQTMERKKERINECPRISLYQSRQTREPSQSGLTLWSSSLGATTLYEFWPASLSIAILLQFWIFIFPRLFTWVSPPRPSLGPRVAHVGLRVEKWQRDYFLRKLWFSPINIIPPMVHNLISFT